MPIERLQVILEMAAGQYKREAREAASATGKISDEARTAGTATGGLQTKMTGFGSVMKGAAVTGAILTVGNAVGDAISRAEDMASQYAITEQVIRQTGGAANVTAQEIEELSRQQSILTGVDKALVTEANNVLLTFKNVRNEVGEGNDVFNRASDLILDVSTVMGNRAPAAAKQLAKALNDPVGQLGALGEAGLTFTDQQEDQIKTLARSGDMLSAQKIILEELESQVGGTAVAAADASDKISNAWAEIGEAAGTFLLPFLETAAIELQHVTGLTDDLTRYSQITGQARDSATNLAGALDELGKDFGEIRADSDKGGQGLDEFRSRAMELIDSFGGGRKELEKVRDGLGFLVEEFDLTAEQAEALADILDTRIASSLTDAEIRAREAAAGVREYEDAQEDAQEESERASFIRAIENYKDTAAEARNARDAVREFIDAQRAAVSPAISAVQSLLSYKEALAASNEAVAKHGVGSDEANEAGLRLLETFSNLIGDAQRVADVTGIDLETALQSLGTQAGLTDDQIQFIIDSLEELDGIKAEAEITATFQERGSRLVRDALRKGADIGGGAFATPITIRHGGGRLDRGEASLIGTPGHEEMFIPDRPGFVVSNPDTQAILAALGASRSGDTNFNVNLVGTGDPVIDAQRVGSTASVLRRMETRN